MDGIGLAAGAGFPERQISADGFERKVEEGFALAEAPCGEFFAPGKTVLFGVSGGADSVAMLLSCLAVRDRLFPGRSARFVAVTVDHGIRPPEESSADARFVQELCAAYGAECRVVRLAPGLVAKTSLERLRGVEEAARFLRYGEFGKAAADSGADLFCLAHNRNDQLETLVMRFLQGSGGEAAAGIPCRRGIFCRPMLGIPRESVERYLELRGIPYRTDSTNSDTSFLRNRIRSVLLPVLSDVVPGWDKAVISGAEKRAEDARVLEAAADGTEWTRRDSGGSSVLFMEAEKFFSVLPAVRRTLLYRGFALLGARRRIPYAIVREAVSPAFPGGGPLPVFRLESGGTRIESDGTRIALEKIPPEDGKTSGGFYAVLDSPGLYELPCGTVRAVSVPPEAARDGIAVFEPPVVVRSPMPGDSVASGGTRRNLADHFASLGVSASERCRVPVVELAGGECLPLVPPYVRAPARHFSVPPGKSCLSVELLPQDSQNL